MRDEASADDPDRVIRQSTEKLRYLSDNDEIMRTLEDRAAAWRKLGQYELARSDAQEMIRLCPESPQGYHELAWLLSACPDDQVRDAARAVSIARKAVRLDGNRISLTFDDPAPPGTVAGRAYELRWSRYRDTLAFERVPGREPLQALLIEPFQRDA